MTKQLQREFRFGNISESAGQPSWTREQYRAARSSSLTILQEKSKLLIGTVYMQSIWQNACLRAIGRSLVHEHHRSPRLLRKFSVNGPQMAAKVVHDIAMEDFPCDVVR